MWDSIKEALYIVSAITTIIAGAIQIADSFKKNSKSGRKPLLVKYYTTSD